MILDAIVLAVLLAFVFWGSKRGLARMAFSAVSSALAIVAGYVLYRPVSAFLSDMKISVGLAEKMKESGALDSLPGIMTDLPFAETAADGIYITAAEAAVSAASLLAVIVIVRLVLFVVSLVVGVAGNLPIVRRANSFGGGVLGFVLGLLFELIIFALAGVAEAFGSISIVSLIPAGSNIAAFIYNNNPLLELIK